MPKCFLPTQYRKPIAISDRLDGERSAAGPQLVSEHQTSTELKSTNPLVRVYDGSILFTEDGIGRQRKRRIQMLCTFDPIIYFCLYLYKATKKCSYRK